MSANHSERLPASVASGGLISERPQTPATHAAQVALLEDDGGVTLAFEQVLADIFVKYCIPKPSPFISDAQSNIPNGAVLTDEALDAFARDTNGEPFSPDTKEELKDFMDCDDAGNLTWNGFVQMYTLQTESDEEETWRDLSRHGYDRHLQLTESRLEDAAASQAQGHSVPKDHVSGIDSFRQEGQRDAMDES